MIKDFQISEWAHLACIYTIGLAYKYFTNDVLERWSFYTGEC